VAKRAEPAAFLTAGASDARVAARFCAKIVLGPGGAEACWRWAGCIQDSSKRVRAEGAAKPPDWRGRFHAWGATRYAHRVAWRLWRGPLDASDIVMHDCDNSLCVNPWHLLLGDHADNMADMAEKRASARSGV
jgi:hypothetical protein